MLTHADEALEALETLSRWPDVRPALASSVEGVVEPNRARSSRNSATGRSRRGRRTGLPVRGRSAPGNIARPEIAIAGRQRRSRQRSCRRRSRRAENVPPIPARSVARISRSGLAGSGGKANENVTGNRSSCRVRRFRPRATSSSKAISVRGSTSMATWRSRDHRTLDRGADRFPTSGGSCRSR